MRTCLGEGTGYALPIGPDVTSANPRIGAGGKILERPCNFGFDASKVEIFSNAPIRFAVLGPL